MKQVIVMRTDLNMRKGKMIAQGAHASLALTLAHQDDPRVKEWLAERFTKICVRVDSEYELVEVYQAAFAAGLLVKMITDAGFTEFHAVPTRTCLAIGPDTPERLAPVTDDLRLL